MTTFVNPLYEREKDDTTTSIISPVVDGAALEEQRLIDGVGSNTPVKEFAHEFANALKFRALKVVNWVLLLVIVITTTVSGSKLCDLNWSAIRKDNKYMMMQLTITFWGVFILSTLSLIIYFNRRKVVDKSKHFFSCLAVMDACISLFIILGLLCILVYFVLASVNEFQYFYPKLTNDSMSLEDLVEWNQLRPGQYRPYHYDRPYDWGPYPKTGRSTTMPPTTTFSPSDFFVMESRKRQMFAHLALDPTIVLLSFVANLLNLVYANSIRKAIKRTGMWVSDYQKLHPNCSKLDLAYASFFPVGLIKLALWLIPTYIAVAYHFNQGSNYFNLITLCWAIAFGQWLFYLRKVRFNDGGDEGEGEVTGDESDKACRLNTACKLDFFLSFVGLIFYFVYFNLYCTTYIAVKFSWVAIALYLCLIVYFCSLFYRYGTGTMTTSQGSCLPRISINVSINVTKNDKETVKGKQHEEDPEIYEADQGKKEAVIV